MNDNELFLQKVELRNLDEPNEKRKESLRTLRANLQFCGDDVKAILFTGAVPGEGTSTVVVELARSLACEHRDVLVIDADIRKSVLIDRLDVCGEGGKEIFGLTDYLSEQCQERDVIYSTQVPGLYMAFSGPGVPDPTEILEKKLLEDLIVFGRKYFDYILIDTPPVGAAIDAAVIAGCCDGAVLVMAQGQTDCNVIRNAMDQLEMSEIRIIGGVLNRVNWKRNRYYGKKYDKNDGKY